MASTCIKWSAAWQTRHHKTAKSTQGKHMHQMDCCRADQAPYSVNCLCSPKLCLCNSSQARATCIEGRHRIASGTGRIEGLTCWSALQVGLCISWPHNEVTCTQQIRPDSVRRTLVLQHFRFVVGRLSEVGEVQPPAESQLLVGWGTRCKGWQTLTADWVETS